MMARVASIWLSALSRAKSGASMPLATSALRRSKKVCAGCPVREACLEWALATGQHAGVWGGLAEGERLTLARVRKSSAQVCLVAQVWIERELAKGRAQKAIARDLDVDPGVLSRVVQQFEKERAAALALEMQGVKA